MRLGNSIKRTRCVPAPVDPQCPPTLVPSRCWHPSHLHLTEAPATAIGSFPAQLLPQGLCIHCLLYLNNSSSKYPNCTLHPRLQTFANVFFFGGASHLNWPFSLPCSLLCLSLYQQARSDILCVSMVYVFPCQQSSRKLGPFLSCLLLCPNASNPGYGADVAQASIY